MIDGTDTPPLSGIRLLVVGDEDTRTSLRTGLYPRFDVTEAGTAEQARTLVRARWFNAVVADYMLEDGSGLALLRDLERECPHTHRILISKYAVPNLFRLLDDGLVELFLAKPVDPDEFSAFFRSA